MYNTWAAIVAVGLLVGIGPGAWFYLARRRWQTAFAKKLTAVRADPLRLTLHLDLLRIAGDAPKWVSLPLDRAYRTALDLLAAHPNSLDLKVLALALGELHLGRQRPGGRPTAEDMATVKTEVLARAP